MTFSIPRLGTSLTRVTSRAGAWSHKMVLGPFHRTYTVSVPDGIDANDLEVVAEAIGDDGKVVGEPTILKAPVKPRKPKVVVEAAPKLESEAAPEPATEWKPRTRRKYRTQESVETEVSAEQSVAAE